MPDDKIATIVPGGKNGPDIYLDVCHNPQAVESVLRELERVHPTSKIHVVCGFSKQKDMSAMLHHLASSPNVKSIHGVTSPHFKLQGIDAIINKFAEVKKTLHPYIE